MNSDCSGRPRTSAGRSSSTGSPLFRPCLARSVQRQQQPRTRLLRLTRSKTPILASGVSTDLPGRLAGPSSRDPMQSSTDQQRLPAGSATDAAGRPARTADGPRRATLAALSAACDTEMFNPIGAGWAELTVAKSELAVAMGISKSALSSRLRVLSGAGLACHSGRRLLVDVRGARSRLDAGAATARGVAARDRLGEVFSRSLSPDGQVRLPTLRRQSCVAQRDSGRCGRVFAWQRRSPGPLRRRRRAGQPRRFPAACHGVALRGRRSVGGLGRRGGAPACGGPRCGH